MACPAGLVPGLFQSVLLGAVTPSTNGLSCCHPTFPSPASPLQVLVDQYTGSSILEVQTRSCEYSHIFKLDKIRGALLEHIPPLDESTYSRNIGNSAVMMDGQAAQVRCCLTYSTSDS